MSQKWVVTAQKRTVSGIIGEEKYDDGVKSAVFNVRMEIQARTLLEAVSFAKKVLDPGYEITGLSKDGMTW